MPYIGRSHVAGDHISNFKVLDDISSYTATFDGSSTNVVSTANETLRIVEHRFIQGQRVTYTNGGGGNIGGLTTGTAYFVTFDTNNTIKLATTLANANSNTNINLSSVGSGSSHTLTAAFDGVNQNFKATHSGGSDVRINNSTQLQIAINNVIQKPNNISSYTEGFRVVDSEKIQFKNAPTSNDVFWGTVIANTIETFDISDNKVDNLTGDGSTTEFNLSSAPPSNNSIVVTINGVVQHPSDANNARAYSLNNQLLIFTSAPANGDEIQVRHIGFAGASTGDVTGFYGRVGNVVLGTSDNISVGNVNVGAGSSIAVGTGVTIESNGQATYTGVVTALQFKGDGSNLTGIDATALKDTSGNVKIQAQASGAVYTGVHTFTTLKSTSADFSGSVSIGGTLTYEDVTNIDSVGVITARDNIKVGTGVTIESNGQATFVGVVTFGSGSTTINNNVVNVGTALTLGHTQGLQFHTQNLHSAGFEVNQINVSGASTIGGNLDANGDLDVDGHTNLDNASIAGITTYSKSGSALRLNDGSILRLGNADSDFFLYHDGNNIDYISAGATKQLRLTTDDFIIKGANNTETLMTAAKDGAVHLYHNNISRLSTSSVGVSVSQDLDVDGHTNLDNVSIAGVVTATTFSGSGASLTALNIVTDTSPQLGGNLDVNTKNIVFGDSGGTTDDRLTFGAGTDLSIYHDGSNSYVKNSTGTLLLNSDIFTFTDAAVSKNGLSISVNGSTNFYWNGTRKAYTHSTGFVFEDSIRIADSDKIEIGDIQDLQIYHNGTNSYIDNSTGSLYIRDTSGGDVRIQGKNGEDSIICNDDGSVDLYHDNTLRAYTTNVGLHVNTIVSVSDNGKFRCGNGDDLEIYHDGTNSYIANATGGLRLSVAGGSNQVQINKGTVDEQMARFIADGAVELYHNNVKQLETDAGGIIVTDNDTTSYVNLTTTSGNAGYLYASGSTDFGLLDGQQHWLVKGVKDGKVELRYDNSVKLETTSAGITVTGTVDSASDVILKENIKTIDNALDKVTKLRGVEYDYKENKKHSIGVIAQEVEEVLPELVNGSEQKSVAYGNIAAVLIEAIKEQNEIINKMKKEIEELKG